ncbi:phage head-tail adaptor, putative, SPP1 family [Sphingomonas sp. YR710]|uniref:phage head closure protein n=1 Tax=Sphingomonas sp. YR710 TaxID=1882773 RepID=UPI00088AB586|nr:phage head closure protein [Sphingomonas sp. YR710]SDC30866.1 phage head-tail adaptor, putative, SPP1 family [Sphingomonas sp. YR710]
MKSGQLNRRVIVQRATSVSDGAGGQVREWPEIGRPWVKASLWSTGRGAGGGQSAVADVMQDNQAFVIRMRPRDIATGDRIVLDGLNYRVRAVVDPNGRRRELQVSIELEVPENA